MTIRASYTLANAARIAISGAAIAIAMTTVVASATESHRSIGATASLVPFHTMTEQFAVVTDSLPTFAIGAVYLDVAVASDGTVSMSFQQGLLSDSAVVTESVLNKPQIPLTEAITASESTFNEPQIPLTEVITASESTFNRPQIPFTETITIAEVTINQSYVLHTEAASATDYSSYPGTQIGLINGRGYLNQVYINGGSLPLIVIPYSLHSILDDTVAITESISNEPQIPLTEAITASESTFNEPQILFTETVTFDDSIIDLQNGWFIAEAVTIAEAIINQPEVLHTEAVSTADDSSYAGMQIGLINGKGHLNQVYINGGSLPLIVIPYSLHSILDDSAVVSDTPPTFIIGQTLTDTASLTETASVTGLQLGVLNGMGYLNRLQLNSGILLIS